MGGVFVDIRLAVAGSRGVYSALQALGVTLCNNSPKP
jgi:hypothetical protein